MKPLKPILLSLSLALPLGALARADLVERVIVRVNGDIVTQSEFEARQVAAVQTARIGPNEVERYLRDNNARILQEAIDELLLVQRAGELGYKVPSSYLNEVIEGIKKENNIATDDELRDQLRREGLSLDDLKRNIERSVLRRQVLQRELESKMTVPEPEVRAEYDAKIAEYTREPSVTLQEILVKGDDAKEKAASLVSRARGGEDFGELAKTSSEGPTAASGGDLGTLARGDLAPDLQKAAFSLAPGTVSEPIAQGGSYRILKVVERKDGSVVPFAEAKEEISRRLAQNRMTSAYDEYVANLRKTALVDLKVREVPLSVDLPVGPGLEAPTGAATVGGGFPAAGGAPAVPASASPAAPASASPATEDIQEFTTSPQARPERVAPPPPAGQPAPAPTPTPNP